MNTNKVTLLPKWRKNHNASELFDEFAEYARQKPSHFTRVMIVYCQDDDKTLRPSYRVFGANTIQAMGMLSIAQHQLYNVTLKDSTQ